MKETVRLEDTKHKLLKKHKYDDIINMEHHKSKKHPPMSLYARSAQFAPFAALTGYEDEVEETARITDKKIEITDEIKSTINMRLQIIQEKINTKPKVTIKYFIPDNKKEGGSYKTVTSNVLKIDQYKKLVVLKDNTKIFISDIINII